MGRGDHLYSQIVWLEVNMVSENNTQRNSASEDCRKHLEFIQATIERMSKASTQIKAWLLPIVTASYAYAVVNDSWKVAVLGMLASFPALYMDCRYLLTERDYRALYNEVALGNLAVPGYSMNPKDIGIKDKWHKRAWCALKSWAIWPFYLSIIAIGVAMALSVVFGR